MSCRRLPYLKNSGEGGKQSEADRKKILESLTPEELATFKEAFTVFDKNQDGTITSAVAVSDHFTAVGAESV